MENSLATFKMDACFELEPKLQISVSEFDITDCLKSCEETWLHVIFFFFQCGFCYSFDS